MKSTLLTSILILSFSFIVFSQTSGNVCPSIRLITPNHIGSENKEVIYTVETGSEIDKYKVNYKWTVTGGRIIGGQNTKSILLLRQRDELSVLVDIEGLPKDCPNSVSESSVIDRPIPTALDEYENNNENEIKEKIDNLFTVLKQEAGAEGVIQLRNDRGLLRHLKLLNNYLNLKGYNKAQVSFQITNEELKYTRLWIIPDGADMPYCKDCLIINAEYFEKLENLFQSNNKISLKNIPFQDTQNRVIFVP